MNLKRVHCLLDDLSTGTRMCSSLCLKFHIQLDLPNVPHVAFKVMFIDIAAQNSWLQTNFSRRISVKMALRAERPLLFIILLYEHYIIV